MKLAAAGVLRFSIVTSIAIGTILSGGKAQAQELSSPMSLPPVESTNDFGVRIGLRGSLATPSVGAMIQHGFGTHWALGGMLWGGRSKRVYVSGTSRYLFSSTYSNYGHGLDVFSVGLEGHAAYYFREHGLRRWGPVLRGSTGFAIRQGYAYWIERRFLDGLFFFPHSNNMESGRGRSSDMSTFFVRLGAYYQFVLGKESVKKGGGHILELGPSAFVPLQRARGEFTGPDGQQVTVHEAWVEPSIDLLYRFVF